MDLSKLNTPLPIESVDFRVQSINKGGYATILAYKDARVDMNRLDEVVGCMNWKREHIIIDGSMYCRVSIRNSATGEWIPKEDVGTESMADKEKGLASDSFKRACFNWGIGRELYDYPRIQIKLLKNEFEDKGGKIYPTYEFDLKSWIWNASFDAKNKLISLSVTDTKGSIRWSWKAGTANVQPIADPEPPKQEEPKEKIKKKVEDSAIPALIEYAKANGLTFKAVLQSRDLTATQIDTIKKALEDGKK